jgi:hypothetical protein
MNENTMHEIFDDPQAVNDLKQIVLARMGAMPDTVSMAIGSEEFAKGDLIAHINKQDDLGTQVMEMELEFLQDLASGAIYQNE